MNPVLIPEDAEDKPFLESPDLPQQFTTKWVPRIMEPTCTLAGRRRCVSSMKIRGGSRWVGSWSNSESVEISVAELISSEPESESDAPWNENEEMAALDRS